MDILSHRHRILAVTVAAGMAVAAPQVHAAKKTAVKKEDLLYRCRDAQGQIQVAQARGAGLGGATLAAFEAWMSRRGATRFRKAVVAPLERALRFLDRQGYREVSRLDGYAAAPHRPTLVILEKEGEGN